MVNFTNKYVEEHRNERLKILEERENTMIKEE
jgi:hypothetical protein